MTEKLKVLMLGWEFPPIINGGLGIACYGIAKALSTHVDLKLILPKSDPDFIVDNVDVIGLNNLSSVTHKYKNYSVVDSQSNVVSHLSQEEYEKVRTHYSEFSELYLLI